MELRRRTALRRCDVPDGALPTNYPDPDPDPAELILWITGDVDFVEQLKRVGSVHVWTPHYQKVSVRSPGPGPP